MNTHVIARNTTVLAACLAAVACVRAQAPGEDPVVLVKKLSIQMQAVEAVPVSGTLDGNTAMPSWLRARIARYEARSFSEDTTGILTNSDVVTTANAQGMQKTCVQEVGSNTVAAGATSNSRYGPSQAPQVVVLRGDLVNICK